MPLKNLSGTTSSLLRDIRGNDTRNSLLYQYEQARRQGGPATVLYEHQINEEEGGKKGGGMSQSSDRKYDMRRVLS